MKERLDKLLTVVFCILSGTGKISGDQFLTIFTVVIGFYFGVQYEKKALAQNTTEERV